MRRSIKLQVNLVHTASGCSPCKFTRSHGAANLTLEHYDFYFFSNIRILVAGGMTVYSVHDIHIEQL